MIIISIIYLCINFNNVHENLMNIDELPDRFKIHFITDHYGMDRANNSCCSSNCGNKPPHLKEDCFYLKQQAKKNLLDRYKLNMTSEEYESLLNEMENNRDKPKDNKIELENINKNTFQKMIDDISYLTPGHIENENLYILSD